MSDKVVVCRCEDVTLHEVDTAIERGHRDLESLKRYTGFGTGWCQGKQCVALCARLLAERGGLTPEEPFTPRPPFHPVPLAHLARVEESGVLGPGVPKAEPEATLPAVPEDAPMPARPAATPRREPDCDVVIVGGGIMGLATAFHLAERGVGRVIVVEKSYLCSGASGRNGGGVRSQWSSETNIQLMKRSLAICRDFATEMRINVWFRQSGYLFLARSEARAEQLARSVELQRSHGLPTRMISPAEAKRLVPELDEAQMLSASHNPEDAVVFPWPFVWGYAKACEDRGVEVRTFTDVTGLATEGERVVGVVTDQGPILAPVVVLATGAWTPELTRAIGLDLPNHPHRHEICSSEPLKPFLKPFVGDLDSGLYFSQSMRGEIVGGVSNPHVPDGLSQESGLRFLGRYARELLKVAPGLGAVRVLRQWAGCYDLTPDGNPLLGFVDEVPGLVLACGFMGHGFMMAPIVGKLLAGHIVAGEEKDLFDLWNLRRYREGRLLGEAMILG